jgi:predicted nucleic acid-binding protein
MIVVDTCILIDIADDDASFASSSVECLTRHLSEGVLLSPVSYVELAPVFAGSTQLLDEFLVGLGVDASEVFTPVDRVAAFRAWARHVTEKRAGRTRRRPAAGALIGALAVRHDGIITRNGDDFRSFYPNLRIVDPTSGA